MSNQLAIIEQKLTSTTVTQDLMLALDLRADDENSIREAKKYTNSVLMEIKRTQGGDNHTDLTMANPDSIVRAMIDAAKFKLQIDGRKLCFLEKRGNNVTLQINTNGFVAKIKESYPDASFIMTPVFKGDPAPKITTHENGNKSCEFTSTNVFGTVADLLGILVQINYTDHGGKKIQDVEAVPISDLKQMQSQSKSKAWGSYTIERMKTAALKRATKWHFRKNSTLQQLIEYDNQENYNLEAAAPQRSSIIDNINRAVAQEQVPEPEEEIIDAEIIEDAPVDVAALIVSGEQAALKGVALYRQWLSTLDENTKSMIKHKHAEWSKIAKAADAEEEFPL